MSRRRVQIKNKIVSMLVFGIRTVTSISCFR